MFSLFLNFWGNLSRRLSVWAFISWFWLANLLALAVMIGFRGIKTSGIAQTFEFDDVPLLHQLDLNYPWLMWTMLGTGSVVGLFLLLGGFSARRENRQFPLSLLVRCIFTWGLGLFACRFGQTEAGLGVDIQPVGFLDWLTLLFGCSAAWSLSDWMARETRRPDLPEVPRNPELEHAAVRISVIYLLGCASVAVYAFREHAKFFQSGQNGGYDYRPFFRAGEIEQANWLFYSTSLLFATLAALGGCAAYLALKFLSRGEQKKPSFFTATDCRRQALVLAAFWSAALTVPWEVKILPEIIANDGWILPAVSLGFISAGLMPLLMASGLLMKHDFEFAAVRARLFHRSPWLPRRSEMAFWNFLLFPLYPVLRFFCLKRFPSQVRRGRIDGTDRLDGGRLDLGFSESGRPIRLRRLAGHARFGLVSLLADFDVSLGGVLGVSGRFASGSRSASAGFRGGRFFFCPQRTLARFGNDASHQRGGAGRWHVDGGQLAVLGLEPGFGKRVRKGGRVQQPAQI